MLVGAEVAEGVTARRASPAAEGNRRAGREGEVIAGIAVKETIWEYLVIDGILRPGRGVEAGDDPEIATGRLRCPRAERVVPGRGRAVVDLEAVVFERWRGGNNPDPEVERSGGIVLLPDHRRPVEVAVGGVVIFDVGRGDVALVDAEAQGNLVSGCWLDGVHVQRPLVGKQAVPFDVVVVGSRKETAARGSQRQQH